MRDALFLLENDWSVYYRPGEEPDKRACRFCLEALASIKKRDRCSGHVFTRSTGHGTVRKVNSFAKKRKYEASSALPKLRKRATSNQFGKKTLFVYGSLDGLIEEVVESVFAGFNFQRMSIRQLSKRHKPMHSDVMANNRLDSAQAMEQFGRSLHDAAEQPPTFGDVSAYLSIDPACNWMFNFQAGAGITEDYLRHRLFKPFAHGDELAPGTGLGLSLVKAIVSQLRGEITVESQVGAGTKIVVTLPLEQSLPACKRPLNSLGEDSEFQEQVRELKGLRVRVRGFEDRKRPGVCGERHTIVEDICHRWLLMDPVPDQQEQQTTPDIVLWSIDALPISFDQIEQLAKAPNVVVCQDALRAYRHLSVYESLGHGASFEFISQPIGPRKLARSIATAYKRWMGFPKDLSKPSRQQPNRFRSSHAGQLPTRGSLQKSLGSSAVSTAKVESRHRASASNEPALPTPIGPSKLQTSIDEQVLASHESANPCKLLLVDDNPINLKILSSSMGKLGQAYQAVTNGREAVEAYMQNPDQFVGVLMDISMPVMDGLEATRQIRAYEQRKKLKAVLIMALTGLASDGVHQEALRSGVDMFLTKPLLDFDERQGSAAFYYIIYNVNVRTGCGFSGFAACRRLDEICDL
ncbi:hypothetical protein PCL_07304 [Purpureocillium lilacinum]|uniref:histidine kinase n=1 Tax=Purpureocillium lilacinum TaxID=33203 RepID=A0A2U3DSN7_PURLI|nr:hypothetical protein PCL_07304 [Purpureocillium lilacinum]